MKTTHSVARCEALDGRLLFAHVNYHDPSPGYVSFHGYLDADEMTVTWSNGTTYITANGFRFPAITWPVAGLLVKGYAGDDTINVSMHSSIPVTIFGGDGNDVINGSNGPDTIHGDAGNDYIDGNNGNDYIEGDADNDALIGGAGDDELWGGDGNDALKGEAGADLFRGGAGIDKVDYSFMSTRIKVDLDNNADDGAASGSTSTEFDNVWDDCEWIIAGGGNDTLDASYITTHSVTLIGGAGNDIIAGGAWSDYIDAGSGTDTVIASGGTDTLLNVP